MGGTAPQIHSVRGLRAQHRQGGCCCSFKLAVDVTSSLIFTPAVSRGAPTPRGCLPDAVLNSVYPWHRWRLRGGARPTESRLGAGTGGSQGRAGATGAGCHLGPSALELLKGGLAGTAGPLACSGLITGPEVVRAAHRGNAHLGPKTAVPHHLPAPRRRPPPPPRCQGKGPVLASRPSHLPACLSHPRCRCPAGGGTPPTRGAHSSSRACAMDGQRPLRPAPPPACMRAPHSPRPGLGRAQ